MQRYIKHYLAAIVVVLAVLAGCGHRGPLHETPNIYMWHWAGSHPAKVEYCTWYAARNVYVRSQMAAVPGPYDKHTVLVAHATMLANCMEANIHHQFTLTVPYTTNHAELAKACMAVMWPGEEDFKNAAAKTIGSN